MTARGFARPIGAITVAIATASSAACATLSGLEQYDLSTCGDECGDAAADRPEPDAAPPDEGGASGLEPMLCDHGICMFATTCCFREAAASCTADCRALGAETALSATCTADRHCGADEVCCALDEGSLPPLPVERLRCEPRPSCRNRVCESGADCADTQSCVAYPKIAGLLRCL